MDPGSLFRLDGKVAVVTGGYGGIGSTAAEGLAAAGARVVIAGSNREKAETRAAELCQQGYDVSGVAFDATAVGPTRRAFDELATRYGRVDILVNAVGGQREEMADSVTEDSFTRVWELNLKAAMFQAQAAAKHMAAGGGGKQVHFGSVRSQLALRNRGFAAYCAAKGGLPILCRQLAAEWAPQRINVNVVAPTFVRTMQAARWLDDPAFYQTIVARIPLGRVAETTDVLGAVLFFVSPASDFITGQTLYLDGGLTATQ